MNLANAGYDALIKNKDKSFGSDAVQYANKTLDLLEKGKEPKTYEPFKDKAEVMAMMHYVIGNFSVDNDLEKVSENFYQAVQYDSKIKTTAYPYYIIAFYYDKKYEKAANEFQTKYGKQETETPETKADNARLEKLLRRMMDAYARAAKYAEPTNPSGKAWRQRFIEVYKFLNQGDQGMDAFLNDVTNSPIPDPKTI